MSVLKLVPIIYSMQRTLLMNKHGTLVRSVVVVLFSLIFASALFAQALAGLQVAELTRKLQLTNQQQKELTPVVEQRDKQTEALRTNTSLSKLQKIRKVTEIQSDFRNKAAKILNPEQLKKLDALEAERRAKLTGKP